MDISNGKTYETLRDAFADGASESDIAFIERRLRDGQPVVKFSKGSFKAYRRDESGQLVKVQR